MKRLVTAAVAVPLALLGVFYLPGPWFLVAVLVLMEIAASELVRLAREAAPGGPHRALYLFVPVMTLGMVPEILGSTVIGPGPGYLWLGLFAVAVVMSSLVLGSKVPVEQSLVSIGFLAFGSAYLALPAVSLYRLQQMDPWILVLLFAIVWLGDTAAYYVGSAWGRRKLARRISPNKTWEGSLASLAAAMIAAALWSYWRLGTVAVPMLGVAAVTSCAAQLGDLVESMIKRGAGVKDSGRLFPGHGGVLDRIDALLFAAPVLLLCVVLFEIEAYLK